MSDPYYEDDHVRLFHGDCREITEWLAADVLVTDPPYGMAYTGFGGRSGEPRRSREPHEIVGDTDTRLRDDALRLWGERPAIIFGTWRVNRPTSTRQLVVWDKSANGPGMGALDLPWGPSHEEIYVIGRGFVGKRAGSVYRQRPFTSSDGIRPEHPTPKPTALMEQLVGHCPAGVVTDPFAGSGSTLIAARNIGRRSIGVEIEERYCEVIARRLDQGVLFDGATS